MAGFFRRLSHAVLPSVPNSTGSPAPHVPRRATETYSHKKSVTDTSESDAESEGSKSRASWELSEAGSSRASTSSGTGSDASSDSAHSDSDDSESDGEDARVRDRFDMMTRYLWSTADRQGWFRDAEFDGLISIR